MPWFGLDVTTILWLCKDEETMQWQRNSFKIFFQVRAKI